MFLCPSAKSEALQFAGVLYPKNSIRMNRWKHSCFIQNVRRHAAERKALQAWLEVARGYRCVLEPLNFKNCFFLEGLASEMMSVPKFSAKELKNKPNHPKSICR